jgi:hypothetical protein
MIELATFAEHEGNEEQPTAPRPSRGVLWSVVFVGVALVLVGVSSFALRHEHLELARADRARAAAGTAHRAAEYDQQQAESHLNAAQSDFAAEQARVVEVDGVVDRVAMRGASALVATTSLVDLSDRVTAARLNEDPTKYNALIAGQHALRAAAADTGVAFGDAVGKLETTLSSSTD